MSNVRDQWAAGARYEDFMGRWSRHLAPKFLSWLDAPADSHWLDVGCGTGALSDAICNQANPASVVGCDPALPLIEFARGHCRDPRQSFVIGGVDKLPARSPGYGSVATLLALNFFPDPKDAILAMKYVATAGGLVSACVWDYRDGMQFLRRFWDAAVALDPAAATLDEGNRFPICHPDAMTRLFHESGLTGVSCEAIEIPTVFENFDSYWRPFTGVTGPAPSYVASLDPGQRANLAQRLAETLPRQPDGTIALTARAWAVRGTVS